MPLQTCAAPARYLQAESSATTPGYAAALFVLETASPHPRVPPVFLDGERHLIGAGAACDVRIEVAGLELQHGEIVRAAAGLVAKRCEGTIEVNGRAVDEAVLRHGDRLRVGPIEFVIRRATTEELIGRLPAPAGARPASQQTEPDLARLEDELARGREELARLKLREEQYASLRAELDDRQIEWAWRQSAVENANEREARHLALRRDRLYAIRKELNRRRQAERDAARAAESHAADLAETERLLAERESDLVRREESVRRQADDLHERLLEAGAPPEAGSAERGAPVERAPVDREAIRTSLAPLRDLANRSARAAVNKHSRQQFRTSLRIRVPVTVASLGLALLLYGGGQFDAGAYAPQAWAAVALALITGLDLARISAGLKRRMTRRDAAPTRPAGAGSDE